MKKVLVALTCLSLFALVSLVYAPWSTLGTGYAITSNVHGTDIFPATPVMATAGTLDSSVVQVTFRWHFPNDTVARQVAVPVFTNGTMGQWKNGTMALIRYATDTYAPIEQGDWGVQAFFQDSTGTTKAGLDDVISIKATSFNVIPEIPLGTIGAVAAMLLAFGLYAFKGRRLSAAKLKLRL